MVQTQVLSVRDPRWSNEERKTIDCFITTNTLKEEVPFTASPYDSELHGRDVFIVV